jgi:hypothetical protein
MSGKKVTTVGYGIPSQLLEKVDEFLAKTNMYPTRSAFIVAAMTEHLMACVMKQSVFETRMKELAECVDAREESEKDECKSKIPTHILHADQIRSIYEKRIKGGSWKPAHLIRSLAYQYETTEAIVKDIIAGQICTPAELADVINRKANPPASDRPWSWTEDKP